MGGDPLDSEHVDASRPPVEDAHQLVAVDINGDVRRQILDNWDAILQRALNTSQPKPG